MYFETTPSHIIIKLVSMTFQTRILSKGSFLRLLHLYICMYLSFNSTVIVKIQLIRLFLLIDKKM